MCKIRWDMHPIYGQDDCVKDQKRDLIEKFIVDGIENAMMDVMVIILQKIILNSQNMAWFMDVLKMQN